MAKPIFTEDDDALLADLGVEPEAKKTITRTPKEERIIACFEEIERFVKDHDHLPQHGEDKDIFERLYAVRLDKIRTSPECREILNELDTMGLLDTESDTMQLSDDMDDDTLLAELGIEAETTGDITKLKHVKTRVEKRAAEEIAKRDVCQDFATFKALFAQVKQELETNVRETFTIRKDEGFLKTDIKKGDFFILGGQTLYIAQIGEPMKAPNGGLDARLRVIYSNGTESNILLRSLQRAIYKDETSRKISDPSAGPLFSYKQGNSDIESGTIYVLRSKSDHPEISANREILHKIGVTGGSVEKRISNAKIDPTFLMSDVEVVATYELFNINRSKLEGLIHKFFSSVRLDIQINDRFGNPVVPREWFLVPLFVIDEVVEKIKDGTISKYAYDTESASLVKKYSS